MRIHLTRTFVFYICSWLSALSYSASVPEDLDTSGDDLEFSGSGSGLGQDDVANNQGGTVTLTNVTEISWRKDAPLRTTQQTPIAASTPPSSVSLFPITRFTPRMERSDSEALPSQTTSVDHYDIMEGKNATTQSADEVPQSGGGITAVYVIEEYTTALVSGTKETITVVTTTLEETIIDSDDEVEDKTMPTPVIVEEDGTTVPEDVFDAITSKLFDDRTPITPTTDSAGDTSSEWGGSHDGVMSTSPTKDTDSNFVEDNIIPEVRSGVDMAKPDEDFGFDNEIRSPNTKHALERSSDYQNILERKEVLAGVIAGGIVGLAFAVMLVALMVYRMKKKDEGSYALDEHKPSNGGYQKAKRQEEFLA
ncbi:syndecan-1 [Clupea harengus]|uniref:Syndecan n=1 Tax=Clupea harengus TaxID=7950 RepID=A0A6P3VEB8_CLUHA|nr:syndecan-1 [Clupea harengus]